MTCFKCGNPGGEPTTSHAMKRSWYATSLPSRTIHLCEACFVPDRKAGKRVEAQWEKYESVYGEIEYTEEQTHIRDPWEYVTSLLNKTPDGVIKGSA